MFKYNLFKTLKKYYIFLSFTVPLKTIKFFKKQIVYHDVIEFNTRFKTINTVLYFTLYILNKITFFFEVIILSLISSLIIIFWFLICGQIIFILLIYVVLIFCFISNLLFTCSFLKNIQQNILSNDLDKILVIFFKAADFYWVIIGYVYGFCNLSVNCSWVFSNIWEDIYAFLYNLFYESFYYKNILIFLKIVINLIYISFNEGRLLDDILMILKILDTKIRHSVNEFISFFPILISYISGYLYQHYKLKYKNWIFYPYKDSDYDNAFNQIRMDYEFDFEDYDFPFSFIPTAIHFYRFIFTNSHHQFLNFLNPELPKIMFIVITIFIHLTVIYLLIKFIRICFRAVYAFWIDLLLLINQITNYFKGLIEREYQFYKNKKELEKNKSKGNTTNNDTTNNDKKGNEISEAEYTKLSNIEIQKCLEMLDFIDNSKPLKNDPEKRYLYKKNALLRLEKNIIRLNRMVKKK